MYVYMFAQIHKWKWSAVTRNFMHCALYVRCDHFYFTLYGLRWLFGCCGHSFFIDVIKTMCRFPVFEFGKERKRIECDVKCKKAASFCFFFCIFKQISNNPYVQTIVFKYKKTTKKRKKCSQSPKIIHASHKSLWSCVVFKIYAIFCMDYGLPKW